MPPVITATNIEDPPAWARLQRQLIDAAGAAAPLMLKKYTEPGGVPYYANDVDDLYELFYNWGLFYAIGGRDEMLDWALQEYNAITRFFDDGIIGRVHPKTGPQIHNEYYNDTEWHHQGEGNMLFYDLGVAQPAISENVRRARRFAAMFIGEDPQAPNYDRERRIFRSPILTSVGPQLQADHHLAKMLLVGRDWESMRYYGLRASLHPLVECLEDDWDQKPERRQEVIDLVTQVIINGDVPQSMAATALVTNAYLYSGDEKYRRWVLEYVDGWLERLRRNGGIMPDNVGPSGQIGEKRQGQWWGGYYGWSTRFSPRIRLNGSIIGAECALLLSGDFGYLELLRAQLQTHFDHAISRDDGQLLVPFRYGPEGWHEYGRFRIVDLAHLWHASMDPADYELLTRLRDGERERDWNQLDSFGEKNNREGESEYARFQYYDGRNPDWPEQVMRAELRYVEETTAAIRADDRDVATIVKENAEPLNPVVTKGLTQMTMGAPHSIYNGGLLRATVRYFDPHGRRAGLPPDVAALVYDLGAENVGVELVNLNPDSGRSLIVQAGAFGEHSFTQVRPSSSSPQRVDGRHLAVELPPLTSLRLDLGLRRFANRPSYVFPWHGDAVPVAMPSPDYSTV
jgi:hypothetical protein